MQLPFRNRREAGQHLASLLVDVRNLGDVLVLGLPRGGVPVAYEVAVALRAPLDVMVVRKLGVPGHEELAMGAIATGNVQVRNEPVLHELRIPAEAVDSVVARELQELQRREQVYRGEIAPPVMRGRTVVLVDDGLATGSTMRAAIAAVRQQGADRVVVGVPVGDARVCRALEDVADETICAATPDNFQALGLWYEDFRATTDEEVRELLAVAASRAGDVS